MGQIREEFTLIDKFTSVFNNFLNLGGRAVSQTQEITSANTETERAIASTASAEQKMAEMTRQAADCGASAMDHWTRAAARYDKAALSAMYSSEELVQMGFKTQSALEAERQSTEALAQTVQSDAVNAFTAASQAINAGKTPLETYTQKLRQLESQLTKSAAKLQDEAQKYQQIVKAEGAASQAAEKQRMVVEQLTQKVDTLTKSLQDLEKHSAKQKDDFAQTSAAADKVANGGLSNFSRKLMQMAAAYLSVQQAKKLFNNALNENTYELRFQARFGDDVGAGAMQWVRDTANDLGRTTQEVAKATNQFMTMTTSPQNIEGLTELANRFAWFSDDNSFSAMSDAIQKAMTSGNVETLSTQTGISRNLLEKYKVQDMAKQGNVSGFISALNQAADAAGMTQEALEKITDGPQAKLNKFINNMKNGLTRVGQSLVKAFGPTIDRLNEWFASKQGQRFFAALSAALSIAGTIASVFVSILIGVANFISENFTTIILIAAVAAAIFATNMLISAISSLAAAWPLLLIIGIIATVIIVLQKLGYSASDIMGGIAAGLGWLYAFVYNLIADAWNIIAVFAEFFANVFDDPVAAVAHLFFDTFDAILGIVESAANAIDAILQTDMAGAVSGFRKDMQDWVNQTFGENKIKIDRMEKIDAGDTAREWAEVGKDLGKSLDELDLSLDNLTGGGLGENPYMNMTGIDSIGKVDKVGKIEKEVSISDEDIKMLADLSEREYVNKFNLTQLTPNINVNVENNGRDLSEKDIANSVKKILVEQIASHTSTTYA